MTGSTVDSVLNSTYYDIKNPASLASISKLYDSVKHLGVNRKYVVEWLSKQRSHVFHKQTINKFKRNRVLVSYIDEEFQIDLMDIRSAKWNHGRYHFILMVIDVLSKFLFAIPIKRKSGREVSNALRKVFETRVPSKVHSDRGLEFKNTLVQNLFKEYNVYHTTTKDKLIKASVVERVIRTIRMKLEKLKEADPNFKLDDALPKVIHAYNHSKHRSIKMRPVDVNIDTQNIALRNLYGGKSYSEMLNAAKLVRSKYKVGDFVRLKIDKDVFQKGYHQLWSSQAFRISRIVTSGQIPTYVVRDNMNKDLDRRYYHQELQKVAPPENYITTIINKRQRNGITECYVTIGDSNLWVPEYDIFNIK